MVASNKIKNRRGQLGGFVTTFVATIIIVILILLFLLFSGLVKLNAQAVSGKVILKEDSLGIKDGVGYMENYFKLVEARNLYHLGNDFDSSLSEVGYGK